MTDFLKDFLTIFMTDFLEDFLTDFLTDFYDRFFGQIFDSFGDYHVSKYIKKGNLPKRLRTTALVSHSFKFIFVGMEVL